MIRKYSGMLSNAWDFFKEHVLQLYKGQCAECFKEIDELSGEVRCGFDRDYTLKYYCNPCVENKTGYYPRGCIKNTFINDQCDLIHMMGNTCQEIGCKMLCVHKLMNCCKACRDRK